MTDDADLTGWCGARLGSPVETGLFEVSQLSRVPGVRLVDGREVVIKARPWEDRVPGLPRDADLAVLSIHGSWV